MWGNRKKCHTMLYSYVRTNGGKVLQRGYYASVSSEDKTTCMCAISIIPIQNVVGSNGEMMISICAELLSIDIRALEYVRY